MIDLTVLTTAVQLEHLFQVAGAAREADLLEALRKRTLIASIGPSVNEALAAQGLRAAIVPEHPKLGFLAAAIAQRAPALLAGPLAGGRSDG